jgi:hypothetical protein
MFLIDQKWSIYDYVQFQEQRIEFVRLIFGVLEEMLFFSEDFRHILFLVFQLFLKKIYLNINDWWRLILKF